MAFDPDEFLAQQSSPPPENQGVDIVEFDPDRFVRDAGEAKYGGVVGGLEAGALGLARGASMGLSDVALTKTGLVNPETIAGLENTNPVITGLSEFGGAAASLLFGGAPASLLAKGGAALAARVGTKTLAKKVLGAAAAGAIEGGTFSAVSGSAHEYALGDPTLNAEKIAEHFIGGALVGGSIGAALGLGKASVEAVKSMRQQADEALRVEGFRPKAERQEYFEGLKKLRKDAPETIAAAEELGAPILEGPITDSKHLLRTDGALLKSPTEAGVMRQAEYQEAYDISKNAIETPLSNQSGRTMTELSDDLKNNLTNKFEQKISPINDAYEALKESTKNIEIPKGTRETVQKNLEKIIEDEGLVKGTAERAFVESFSKGVLDIDNLDKLKKFRTAMGRATNYETKYVSGLVREALDTAEYGAIKRGAASIEGADQILQDVGMAKESYKQFRREIETFGKGFFGKKKIYGPSDFLDKVNEMKPSEFARKLFNKDSVEFAGWFGKNFPEEFEALKSFKKSEIFDKATKSGTFNPKVAMNEIHRLEPEIKKALFSPEELKKMGAGKTYLDALSRVTGFNPSDTGTHLRYAEDVPVLGGLPAAALDLIQLKPIDAIMKLGSVKSAVKGRVDKRKFEYIKNFGPLSDGKMGGLWAVARGIKRTTDTINAKAKMMLEGGTKIVGANKGPISKMLLDHKDEEKREKFFKDLNTLNNDPSKMIERLHASTEHLQGVAPDMAQAVQGSIMRGTQFLASKIPISHDDSPFAAPYKPSQAEIARFNRYAEIVEKPMLAMDQLIKGTLTSETLEALQAVHPKLYEEMKGAIMNQAIQMTSKKKPISYKAKQSMSMFLGQPVMSGFSYPSILANQLAFKKVPGNTNPFMATPSKKVPTSAKLTLGERTGTRRPFSD